jgi:hypothetical protein
MPDLVATILNPAKCFAIPFAYDLVLSDGFADRAKLFNGSNHALIQRSPEDQADQKEGSATEILQGYLVAKAAVLGQWLWPQLEGIDVGVGVLTCRSSAIIVGGSQRIG